MTKRDAGALAGKATASKYGKDYMREIASRGGSYRLPTIRELRLINNHKGGKITDLNNNVFQMPDGVIIQRSKTENMVK